MRRTLVLTIALAALAACEQQPEGEPVVRANLDGSGGEVLQQESAQSTEGDEDAATEAASACRKADFEGAALTHCIADPAQHRIATAFEQRGSTRYGSLANYAQTVDATTIAFAINAGPNGDSGKPRGYYVEDKNRIVELNRSDGDSNFFLKPNGVFFGTGGTWRVLATPTFYSTIGDRPQFGTQSGPMLVVDGKLHPEIAENGPSRSVRSGVGVTADGKAHFVITDEPVSFGQIARFFRDEIKAKNALFLNSGGSTLWDPATKRLDTGNVGAIIVVTKRNSQ